MGAPENKKTNRFYTVLVLILAVAVVGLAIVAFSPIPKVSEATAKPTPEATATPTPEATASATPEPKNYKTNASPKTVHELWDIEWKNSPGYVKEKLKEDKGIIVNENIVDMGFTYIYNYYTNEGFSLLNYTANIRYRKVGDNESITLSFSPIENGTHEDYMNRFYTVVDTYYEKYGLPTSVYLEIYSEGEEAWDKRTCDSVHEVKILEPTPIYALDVAALADERNYITANSSVILHIIMNNIEIRTSFSNGENDDGLNIIYDDGIRRINYSDDIFEEYHLKEYSDTGI